MPEIAEALQAAFDKVEAETPVEVVETEKPSFDRARDDLGRFSQHEPYKTERAEKTEKTENPVEQAQEEKPQEVKGPPKSWKKDYHDHWGKLDPAIQDYVLQREDEYYRGVGTYKQSAELGQQFMEAAKPYEPLMKQLGVNPVQAFQALANADYTLRTADRSTKAQLFAQLAQQYGVDLTDVQAPPIVDPSVAELQQTVMQMRQSLLQQQQMYEDLQRGMLEPQIQQYQTKPHFEDLRPTMAQLLQNGMAQTLEDAYDKALRLNPQMFDEVQAQQRQAEEQKRLQEAAQAAARAKTVAVQVRGSPSTALPATRTDLRSALEAAWDQSIR
jgi:hypothetical protein